MLAGLIGFLIGVACTVAYCEFDGDPEEEIITDQVRPQGESIAAKGSTADPAVPLARLGFSRKLLFAFGQSPVMRGFLHVFNAKFIVIGLISQPPALFLKLSMVLRLCD
jgi:hypothetical protein